MSTSDTPTSISGAVAEQHSTVQQDVRGLLAQRPVQLAALTALLVASGVIALTLKFCVLDLDIWWHLKVGDWMVAHHAVPHTGILSRTAAGRPWIAYSWGYEVLMSLFYRWLGILGVGWYGVLLTVGVTYAIYWMLRRIAGSFWIAWLLTAITCYAFLLLMMPRPVYFSIILFCVALAWLVEADRSGDFRRLYWLPALFFVWANLHIQFIYGLFLVGLLFGVALLQWVAEVIGFEPEWLRPATLSPFRVGVIFAACVVATCIGPNWFHPYLAIASYSKAKVTYGMIIELQALNFHAVAHYIELLLAATSLLRARAGAAGQPVQAGVADHCQRGRLPHHARFVVPVHSGGGVHCRQLRGRSTRPRRLPTAGGRVLAYGLSADYCWFSSPAAATSPPEASTAP